MKRSDALRRIKEFNDVLDPYDDREFEEQMLWFVEYCLGMSPPTDETLYTKYYMNEEYTEFDPKWEDE